MHDKYIILLADKNLGPCVINREIYIRKCLTQHLSDKSTYERISKDIAFQYIEETINEFLYYIKQPGHQINKEDYNII